MELHAAEVELVRPDRDRLPFVVTNSTVPISVLGLKKPLPASTRWIIEGYLHHVTTPSAGLKVDLLVPSYARYSVAESQGSLRGVLVMGAEPGVVSLLAAQRTAELSNTVFYADASWIRFVQWRDSDHENQEVSP
jgi:hypothetical protein